MLDFQSVTKTSDKRHLKTGRKKKLSDRDNRRILNTLEKLRETTGDLKRRLTFVRKVKRLLPSEFRKDGVAFYLDGVSWAHKTNPCEQARSSRTRTWRQQGEGLPIHCTAKGRKEGSGGWMVKLKAHNHLFWPTF